MARWALENFEVCVERWRQVENPPVEVVREVLEFFTERFNRDPFRQATRHYDGLSWADDDGVPVPWVITLPFGSRPRSRVVCEYLIDPIQRKVRCLILGEADVGITG